jgi:aminomethyltransferase
MNTLRTLPLEDIHQQLGARFGEFAGWRMPLWYGGALKEHIAVRNAAGVFDISHMGRFRVAGQDAAALLAASFSRDPSRLDAGASVYALCCNESGGIIDDLLVYRLDTDAFLVICNAANAERVGAILRAHLSGRSASIDDLQPGSVLLAIQGPAAVERVARILGTELLSVRRHACIEIVRGDGQAYFCARGGYTGEDGFEVMTDAVAGSDLLRRLIEDEGCTPCGLAARDSLRLEAALPLHGHDIDESTLPWEAGLGWAVELDHDFPGRAALEASRTTSERRLACLLSDGQGIFRSEQAVYDGDEVVSSVASGGFAPMLDRSIAMAYLPRALAREGTPLTIDIRGRRVACHVVKRPFYTSPDLAQKRLE